MNWETYFSSLGNDTQHWLILGTRRYMLWVAMGRPSLAEFYSREKQERHTHA